MKKVLAKQSTQNACELVPLSEAVLDAPKKEIVLTCLQEGRGNVMDRRWYSRKCVEGLQDKVYARRKIFIDHVTEDGKKVDSLKDWGMTILKTWVVESEGVLHRKVRAKVHDDWLWARCVEAPGELALSIEGRGEGEMQTIEGEEWTVIENIPYLNAFKLVPYPGNAKMGADVVEGASNPQEDSKMDLTKLSLEELKKGRPDLYGAAVKEGHAEGEKIAEEANKKAEAAAKKAELAEKAKAGDAKSLTESFRVELDARLSENAKVIKTLTEKNEDLSNRLDAKEVREKLMAKESMIDKMFAESDLPQEAKTTRFRESLMRLTEKKDGDKVISVGQQVRDEIEERTKLCTGGEAVVRESGSSSSVNIDPDKLSGAEFDVWQEAVFEGEDGDRAVEKYREKVKKVSEEAAAKK